MSGPPARIVCQVSGVGRLPTGWLMKGFAGRAVSGLAGGAGEEGRGGGCGVGLTLLFFFLGASIGPAVDSQLFRHHNKQRPHKGPAGGVTQPVWDTGRHPPPTPPPERRPSDQFLHCRYGNRAVSIGLGLRRV